MIDRIEGPQEPNREGLDEYTMLELLEYLRVPGISVAVINNFKIDWAKGWGIADTESGAPVEPDTLFQAGSISKPVAAMATLKAVQRGAFALDDDINSVLKSWKLPDSEFMRERCVTPRMLLSHTAGLGDGAGFPGYDPGVAMPTVPQILDGVAPANTGPVRLERPPLSGSRYSGGGSTIQQLALSDALGKPFETILREDIFEPIGMTRSTFDQPISAELDTNAARAHENEGKAGNVKWRIYPELAAAGLWSTACDLAKFAIEVQLSLRGLSDRVLEQRIMREMITPAGIGSFAQGFYIAQRGNGWYFQHTGGTWGFRGIVRAHQVLGYGVAILTNSGNGEALFGEVIERVERAYGWDSLDKPVPMRKLRKHDTG